MVEAASRMSPLWVLDIKGGVSRTSIFGCGQQAAWSTRVSMLFAADLNVLTCRCRQRQSDGHGGNPLQYRPGT